MKRAHLAVMLVCAILLTACGGKGVYGTVTNGETGDPIAGATVTLKCTDCASNDSARTDADGKYSFPDPAAGKYVLSIVWKDPPACPGITPFETLGTSGDFLITYAGYGGLGGTGNKSILAVAEFEFKEGQGKKYNLEIACP